MLEKKISANAPVASVQISNISKGEFRVYSKKRKKDVTDEV